MIERIDEKLKVLINDILDKHPLTMTQTDYMILQDYSDRKLAEERDAKQRASWNDQHKFLMQMISGLGMNGGDPDVQ